MTTIRDQLRNAAQNATVTKTETQQLVDAAKADGTVSAQEKADLKNAVERYQDAFDSGGWQTLKQNAGSLGVKVHNREPLTSLAGRPELADVAAGRKALSTTKNRNDPAVQTVQRALMTLARLENKPAIGLPKFGADGDFGSEATAAVKAFQSSQGLTPDGVVGKKTLEALDKALQAASRATPPAPPPGASLKNDRFKGDATLQAVAAGSATLQAGAKGEPVKAVQNALLDMGYAMPKFGADGDFGGETRKAVREFQTDRKLPVTGNVDAATLAALDKAAPKAGAKAVVFPEYGEMFKDGVLATTIAIGYDETGADLAERRKVLDGLRGRGFTLLDVKNLTDAQLKQKGLDPAQLDRKATYYLKSFTHEGKEVKALVRYVDRYTEGHKDRFAQGFANDDLVLYGGHARYGSGPDFDDKESAAGNFVVGANAAGHKNGTLTPSYDAAMRERLKGAGNDLEKAKMTDRYQMMFFSGCTTAHYLDELRGIPGNKDRTNLDLVVSDEVLYWSRIGGNVLGTLDGVMGGKSMNDIHAQLTTYNNGAGFTYDGFGGNSYQR
jgi:peptidoglycan hydrolase-like protein with peptidoglycan-binding domain